MAGKPDFRIGPHRVHVRRTAGAWTAAVDGAPILGLFMSQAQASGAALLETVRLDQVQRGEWLRIVETVFAVDAD